MINNNNESSRHFAFDRQRQQRNSVGQSHQQPIRVPLKEGACKYLTTPLSANASFLLMPPSNEIPLKMKCERRPQLHAALTLKSTASPPTQQLIVISSSPSGANCRSAPFCPSVCSIWNVLRQTGPNHLLRDCNERSMTAAAGRADARAGRTRVTVLPLSSVERDLGLHVCGGVQRETDCGRCVVFS